MKKNHADRSTLVLHSFQLHIYCWTLVTVTSWIRLFKRRLSSWKNSPLMLVVAVINKSHSMGIRPCWVPLFPKFIMKYSAWISMDSFSSRQADNGYISHSAFSYWNFRARGLRTWFPLLFKTYFSSRGNTHPYFLQMSSRFGHFWCF